MKTFILPAKYEKARTVFEEYLNEFPNGSFRQNAQYYLAECLRTSGNKDEALKLYIEVTSNPNGQFLEQSLIQAASILVRKRRI